MGPLLGELELSKALIEAGNNLLKPHSSTDVFLTLLDETDSLLSTVPQDPIGSVQNALLPSMKALVSADLLRNSDSDVRVFVVSCLTEIMRITAPEAPYNDEQMKEIFQATVEAFGKLADASCRSYKKAEAVLETVAKVRSSLVMLDLECDDLVLEMFRQFLKTISSDHPQQVLRSMETVMITVIDESEEVSMDLLEILLAAVKKESRDVSPTASRLVEKVLSNCVRKLQPCIMGALKSTGTSLDMYSQVVLSLFQNESATTQAHTVVHAKENEADEKISEKQLIPSDSLMENLDVGISRKGNRSKRTARGGTRQLNGDDKARIENDLNQLLKLEQSESTDAETELGSTGKRRRRPNSLKNPEEGYSFKTSSSNKMQDKGIRDSSLRKLAAKKVSLPTKVGQTNQSVVISISSSSKARTGSRKRSRTKMEEMSNDDGSIATPLLKKQIVKKDNPGEDLKEPNLEKPEDGIKTAKSSKKKKARNGLVKSSAKKPLEETKMEEMSNDVGSIASSKKQIMKTDNPEKDLREPNLEKPEDGIKTTKSSKKKKAQNGLVKASAKKPLEETKMEEMSNDVGSIASSKKQIVKKDNQEKDLKEPNLEKPEDGIKTAMSSKKERAQNGNKGLVKASAKKPLEETKMEETSNDVGSIASSKKQIVMKDNQEKDLEEPNLEKPEGGNKTAKSSKKERAQNGNKGLVKTPAKKPLEETKMAKTSVKKSVHSDAKKKNSGGASMDTPIAQSSKSKKKNSREPTPLTKKTERTPKGHPNRKRTAGEEEANTNEFGEELVGKKVNVWWPLDKKFYEGVIASYSSHTKRHLVTYIDGDAEELNLKKERFEIIQDDSPANEDMEIDLPDSLLLSDLVQMQKVKKRKNVCMNVNSSPEVRSSIQTTKKKEPVTNFTNERKSAKGAIKVVSNEPESSDGKKRKSLTGLDGETGRTKGKTGKRQKVTRAMHHESEKESDEKADPETKGEDSLKLRKSKAEPDCMREPQEVPENQNAETITDGKGQKSAKEPNAEPKTDGEENSSLKESNAEPKTDGKAQDAAKEPTGEPKTDGKGKKSAKEPNAEPETLREENSSLKESNAEPETDGKEQDAAKEPTGEHKTDEEELIVAKRTNAELEADEEEQKSVKERNEEPETEGEERKAEKEADAEPETKVEEKESTKEQTEHTKLIEEKEQEIDMKEEYTEKAEVVLSLVEVDP